MHVSIYHLHDTERARARRVPVGKLQLLVGSDANCDLRITDDTMVSPRHLTVAIRAQLGAVIVAEILVTPLAGATLVNGTVIADEAITKLGDTIQIGNTILKFRPESLPATGAHLIKSPVPLSSPNVVVPPPPATPRGAPRPTAIGRPPPPIELPPSQRPTLVPGVSLPVASVSAAPIVGCDHARCPGTFDRLHPVPGDDGRDCRECGRRIYVAPTS